MAAVFFNKGENCIAAGRVFVEERVHDQFLRRVVAEVGKMAAGDPLHRGTAHGPQNHKAHLDKLIEVCIDLLLWRFVTSSQFCSSSCGAIAKAGKRQTR